MVRIRDYDSAVTLIADADYTTRGRLLGRDGGGDGRETYGEPGAGPSPFAGSSGAVAGPSSGAAAGVGTHRARQSTTYYSDEDQHKIQHG